MVQWRRSMVAYVRSGGGIRSAARRFGCGTATVYLWVERAFGRRLDKVVWADRPAGPQRQAKRTPRKLERRIVRLRQQLRRCDSLGYIGAVALRRRLREEKLADVPSVRTINRILRRWGVLPQKRQRRPAPPPGWYLPVLTQGKAELDQIDFVEGLCVRSRGEVEVLTSISLWGKLAAAWPGNAGWHIPQMRPALQAHWQQLGAPNFLQMDNDTRFIGSPRAPGRLGRTVRFCLAAGVVPVFAPPRETGFQASIESFNGLWQTKVWRRFRHPDLRNLQRRSTAFITAHRAYRQRATESAPTRQATMRPADTVIFLRRSDARGRVAVLGRTVKVGLAWSHRLVRCELIVSKNIVRCYALRRREPKDQPLLCSRPFILL